MGSDSGAWPPEDVFSRLQSLSIPEHQLMAGATSYTLYEAEGFRWLCSPPGAVQCAMATAQPQRLVLPNQRAMLLATLLPPRLSRVLDLGTGGAGLARAVQAMPGKPDLVCVDTDAEMVTIARRYFLLPDEQVVCLDDAGAFLSRDTTTYDLIFCDVFEGLRAPDGLSTETFFADLAARLSPGGAIAMNTLPASEEHLGILINLARKQFAGLGVLGFEDLGNVILILSNNVLPALTEWSARLRASPWASDPLLRGFLERLVRA